MSTASYSGTLLKGHPSITYHYINHIRGSTVHTILFCIKLFTKHHLSLIGGDDLFDLLQEMMPIASSWKAIGIGLRIDYGRLQMIQIDNDGNFRACLSAMLTCWLQRSYNVDRFGEPTWRAVVKVVADPAGGDNHALALSIAEQHQGNS